MQKDANADLLNDYDTLKETYEHLQTEKGLLENFNANLGQEFAGAQQQVADVYAVVEDRDRLIADLGLELSTAVEGAETFQSDYDVLTENFNEVKAERTNFNTEISKLKIELANKEKTITNQENSITMGNSEIKNSKAVVQELQAWKQESINETLYLQSELKEVAQKFENLKNQFAIGESDNSNLKAALKNYKAAMDAEKKTSADLNERISQLNNTLNHSELKSDNDKKYIDELLLQITDLGQTKGSLSAAIDILKLEKQDSQN
jgi:chromosome segregation ATPase